MTLLTPQIKTSSWVALVPPHRWEYRTQGGLNNWHYINDRARTRSVSPVDKAPPTPLLSPLSPNTISVLASPPSLFPAVPGLRGTAILQGPAPRVQLLGYLPGFFSLPWVFPWANPPQFHEGCHWPFKAANEKDESPGLHRCLPWLLPGKEYTSATLTKLVKCSLQWHWCPHQPVYTHRSQPSPCMETSGQWRVGLVRMLCAGTPRVTGRSWTSLDQ